MHRNADHWQIDTDGDGFVAHRPRQRAERVRWCDVRGIAAFKHDALVCDEICVAFFLHADDDSVVVTEAMRGFDALMAEVTQRDLGADAGWFSKVAFPAFALCWTVIWGDAPEPAACPRCSANISGCRADACPKCAAPLRTIQCPGCGGAGADRVRWARPLFVITALAALGVVAAAYVRTEPSAALPRPWLIAAVVLGGIAWLSGWEAFGRAGTCMRCEGTGWWDARGRAMRVRAPASSSDSTRAM